MLGPPHNFKTLWATVTLISLPAALYLAFVGVNLWAVGFGAVPVVGGSLLALLVQTKVHILTQKRQFTCFTGTKKSIFTDLKDAMLGVVAAFTLLALYYAATTGRAFIEP